MRGPTQNLGLINLADLLFIGYKQTDRQAKWYRLMNILRGMFNKFCKKKIKDGFRLEILSQPCNFFSKAHYPFRLSSSNGLYSSNFLFLCNPPLPGGCLAPLSLHGNVFNTNQGKRTLGMPDTQKNCCLKLFK